MIVVLPSGLFQNLKLVPIFKQVVLYVNNVYTPHIPRQCTKIESRRCLRAAERVHLQYLGPEGATAKHVL